jgi:hypothetical protein
MMIATRLAPDLLHALKASADRSADPVRMIWPVQGNPVAWVSFASFSEWHDFIDRLGLKHPVPEIVAAKFERAHKLYLLAWLDFDLIKAGELIALTALELALTDRHGHKVRDKKGKIYFHRLLAYLPKHDGLTDEKIPMVKRCGGSVIGMLNGKTRPGFAEIRNQLAHAIRSTVFHTPDYWNWCAT